MSDETAEAVRISRLLGGPGVGTPMPEAMRYIADAVEDLIAERDGLRDELTRLRSEANEASRRWSQR